MPLPKEKKTLKKKPTTVKLLNLIKTTILQLIKTQKKKSLKKEETYTRHAIV